MNYSLLKFKIYPRVLRADKTQTVYVQGLDESCKLHDDCEYTVYVQETEKFTYAENSLMKRGDRILGKQLRLKPKNGVLAVEYFFKGEQLYNITVERDLPDPHEPPIRAQRWKNATKPSVVKFSVYVLADDLYARRPFKGDLHLHSYRSDGNESPMFIAAQYRKYGYDFISLTDHNQQAPSWELIESLKGVKTPFKAFSGEEVHHCEAGAYGFHVVHFNGKYSVNELIEKDEIGTLAQVEKLAEAIDCEDRAEALQTAWYQWIYNEIHKAGGICIYPHPYWTTPDAYHIKPSISERIYQNGYCDAFEMFGGTTKATQGKMQINLYYETCANGRWYPIIASTDAHSTLVSGVSHFEQAWTLVFSESAEKIPGNILLGNTAAVDNRNADDKMVYARLRLARYTYFLLEEYYPWHDAYCNAAGQALLRYVFGEKSENELLGVLEQKLLDFDEMYFGSDKNR